MQSRASGPDDVGDAEATLVRAADRLRAQLDRWEAVATVPVRVRGSVTRLTAPAEVPTVDVDTWYLHVRVARRRDRAARDQLVHLYEDHARHLARRFYRHREPLEDLAQVALEALLLALERFEPRRRVPFLGYANPTIIGSLKRFYRDAGWSLRLPRRVHDLASSMGPAVDMLLQDLGRTPTAAEVADLLDVSLGEVEHAMAATEARAATSLDAATVDGDEPLQLPSTDDAISSVEARTALVRVLDLLPRTDRQVVLSYYLHGRTQQEIAEDLGVSQMQVSRVLARVVRRLRSHLPA